MSETKTETRLAKIVHVIDDYRAIEVVINRGTLDGVKPGDRFLVFGEGPHINDPDTGKDLGRLELVRGRGEVVHVQDHLATIRTIQRRRTQPAKRITRDAGGGFGFTGSGFGLGFPSHGNVIEEELAPEAEMPFEGVRLGDLAKPI